MPRHHAATAATFLLLLASAATAHAQSELAEVKGDIRIGPDRAVTATWHYETTPLVESAVRTAAEAKITSTGNQTFEVVDAFTRKKDGTVIPADPADFVTQDGAVGAAMSFVDLKVHQIPFRALAVGDTTVLTVRIAEKDHYFPGQYSSSTLLPPSAARRTLDVTLHTPASLKIQHDERQLSYRESRQGDEMVRQWSGSAEPIAAEEKDVADVTSILPSLRFSTFSSFEAIATRYYQSAKSALGVTPEIEHLAQEITSGKQDRRAQVEAIFNWVSKNIRYVAVFFGNGRYVPNDTQTILSRRFGDCKDHAALLAALLAAKGIESEQVLIGIGSDHQLPRTPVIQAFNHVIVYVPSLGRYLDPSVAFSSFDHLPGRDLDKPVVLVSSHGAKLARTPTIDAESNTLSLNTRLVLNRDGQQHGSTAIAARGEFADALRGFVAQVEAKGKEVELANLARSRGIVGKLDLQAQPWTDTHEPVRVTVGWTTQQPFNLAGWRAPLPVSPILPNPGLLFSGLEAHQRVYPAICRSGKVVNTLDVSLPDGVVPAQLPPTVEQHGPQFSFREQWSSEENHLHVSTEITSSTSGMVCSPDQVNAVRAAYGAIVQNANPLLKFTSRQPDASAQTVKPAPAYTHANAAASPNLALPAQGQLQAGTSIDNQSPNPNCQAGAEQSLCMQGAPGTPPAAKPSRPTSVATQAIELTRAIPIDHKLQIDFVYSLNADCSWDELPNVRIVERPQEGDVTVENGTGFTNFPPSNQRYECNKQKSQGVVVSYKPHPGFTGSDSVTLDIIFPHGQEMKRHYALQVK